MKLDIEYRDMTPEQKLTACWTAFCYADPIPSEFLEEMEAAGLVIKRPLREWEFEEEPFADERGLYPGGTVWALSKAGQAVIDNAGFQGTSGHDAV